MASGALFGGSAARSSSKNLVEFKAGKMTLNGKMVHPDKRKGLVYVYQSDDSLMHFCWKDRTKGTVEDDLIIFPDDIEFKHVPQCTTGRVYLLKFKSSSRKFFFWMQEPKTEKDEEHRRKVNDLLNNPPTPGSSRGGSGGFSGIPPELASEGDLQNLLGNMNQQQLMQLLGGMGMSSMGGLSQLIGGRPSSSQSESTSSSRVQSSPGPRTTTESSTTSTTPATTTAASTTVPAAPLATAMSTPAPATATGGSSSAASSGILLSDLQNILGSLGAPADAKEPIDLAAAITPEAMIPLLANSEVQERLMPFLPEGEVLPKTAEELRATVSSPQFRQAMSSFSAALASGQLGPLMPQFGLGEDVANAAAQGDVEAFVKAMQAKKDESKDDKKE